MSTTLRSSTQPCQLAETPATQPLSMVHDVITTSSGAAANSATHRTSVSSMPNPSATRRTASSNTAVPSCTISGSAGSSIGTSEAHLDLGLGGVVPGGVGRLEHGHGVDPVADPAREDGEHVGEAGVDAAPEDRHAAALARGDQPVATLAERVTGDECGGAHHVDAGLEDADHLVDVGPLRVVDDAVGSRARTTRRRRRWRCTPSGSMPQSSPTSRPTLSAPTRSNRRARGRGWRRWRSPTADRRCRSSTARSGAGWMGLGRSGSVLSHDAGSVDRRRRCAGVGQRRSPSAAPHYRSPGRTPIRRLEASCWIWTDCCTSRSNRERLTST